MSEDLKDMLEDARSGLSVAFIEALTIIPLVGVDASMVQLAPLLEDPLLYQ